jgi:uncharacterized OB-fold protein
MNTLPNLPYCVVRPYPVKFKFREGGGLEVVYCPTCGSKYTNPSDTCPDKHHDPK